MKEWIVCASCDAEFKVLTSSSVCFCPCCGLELEDEELDEEDEE